MTELVITTQLVLLVALSFCLRQIVRLQRRVEMYRVMAETSREVAQTMAQELAERRR